MRVDQKGLDPLEKKYGLFCSQQYKGEKQATYLDYIGLTIKRRTVGKQSMIRPYFSVTLESGEIKDVSITKHGWRKAWRKALLCKSSNDGNKQSLVRFLDRPPKFQDFID
ncbi:hypothetical protein [Vibrio harveyi]|uniref:hypothetical protein n=1 Tax=Vibrio harveyi TaxID=669 RepID=UPI003CEB1583